MNTAIQSAIEKGKLILLLGAGASYGSQDKQCRKLLNGEELAELLAKEAGLKYSGED